MKEYLQSEIQHVKQNKDTIAFLTIGMVLAASMGYAGGHHVQSQKIPDQQVVSKAAYTSFNYSMQEIDKDNWQNARKHIQTGNSLVSVLYQTGQKKWDDYWFAIAVSCLDKQQTDKCERVVNDTMLELKPQANLTTS